MSISCVQKTTNGILKSTAENTLPFTLSSSYPQDGDLGIGLEEAISLTFSHPVLSSSIVLNNSTNACSGSIQLSDDSFVSCIPLYLVPGASISTTITLKPFGGFLLGHSYKLKVSTDLKNSEGCALASQLLYTEGFSSAGDQAWPTIVSRSPSNLENEIDVMPSIQVIFSEPMDASTFTASNSSTCSGAIQLSSDNFVSCIALVTPVTLLYGGAGFSLSPVAPLNPGSNYRLKLQGILDQSAKGLTTSTILFTTAAVRTVRVSWAHSPSTPVHQIGGGYRVYYSTVSGFSTDHYLTQSLTVPYSAGSYAPNYVDLDFPHKGKWYFRVSAFSSINPLGSEASEQYSLEVQ